LVTITPFCAMTTPLPSALASPNWPLADAPTFTTRTLTTEGRTEAIVLVARDRGAASSLCTSDRAVAANASVEFVCERSRSPNPNETSIATRTSASTAASQMTSPRRCRLGGNALFDAMCISGRRGTPASGRSASDRLLIDRSALA
jgi:hypothetical protein